MIKLETVYGRGGSPYLTRLIVGSLRLHVFHRGDSDPDPHTHPWDFWTFPLTGYWEEVTYFSHGWQAWLQSPNYVRPWRLHRRKASYTHRVMTPGDMGECPKDGRRIITLVWTGKVAQSWGFLVNGSLIPWRTYLGITKEKTP